MAVELVIPSVGESISEVEIGDWLKNPGESVDQDEPVVVIETEKATVELPAPTAGTITQMLKQKGEKAAVGDVIGYMEPNGTASSRGEIRGQTGEFPVSEPQNREFTRLTPNFSPKTAEPLPEPPPKVESKSPSAIPRLSTPREEQVIPMTPIRRRIAERLVEAHKTA